jgi:hypothetical protein
MHSCLQGSALCVDIQGVRDLPGIKPARRHADTMLLLCVVRFRVEPCAAAAVTYHARCHRAVRSVSTSVACLTRHV